MAKIDFITETFAVLTQVCTLVLIIAQTIRCNDVRNLQNHRNGILNLKDVADHWIGFPKSPYTSFSVTVNPTSTTTPPTSAPRSVTKITKQKKKKYKKSSNNKRRSDADDSSDYKDMYRNREKYALEDFDYDYDGDIDSHYSRSYSPSPYIIRASSSAAAPKAVMVNPSVSTSSQSIKAIYAGTPKVATYVVPNTKKYVVQRVKSEAVYAPSLSVATNPSIYSAASNSGMRRIDPLDYDDNTGGSFLNLGPQEGFPPRPVMNKIVQPGQRQPCHGPDCHQHHKGLVRFYWRRVVYPPNEGSRGRGRARFRRPVRGRNRRRRFRDRNRAPSDQTDVFVPDDDEAEETGEDVNEYDNNDEEDEREDNEENDSSRRNIWQPGKAYGHDLNEGNNYDDQDKRVYRDKRYAYRKRRRGSF